MYVSLFFLINLQSIERENDQSINQSVSQLINRHLPDRNWANGFAPLCSQYVLDFLVFANKDRVRHTDRDMQHSIGNFFGLYQL